MKPTVNCSHQQSAAAASPRERSWLQIALALAGVCAASGVGIVAVERGKMELLLLLLVTAVAGLVVLVRPHTAVYLAMFLLYTNAPVVAKRFHHVPSPIVYCVPLLLLVPIAYRFLFRGEQIIIPRLTVWITLFLIVQTIAALLSKDPTIAFGGLMVSLTEGVLLFVLVVNAVQTEQVLRGVVWSLLAGGAFLGAVTTY